MGFFSRWASFLFKALGWTCVRDGLVFLLRPLGGLVFEMGFFSFKAPEWASFRDGLFFLRTLGGLVFEMGFFSF